MGIREPVKLTAASMALKGKKPDEYARAFTSHPEPELLKIHDPEKFAALLATRAMAARPQVLKKPTAITNTGSGLFSPREIMSLACQICHSADMVLVTNDVGWTLTEGKDLFRQRGCTGCHRYEGYDKEPEDLLSIAQQIKATRSREEGQLQGKRAT